MIKSLQTLRFLFAILIFTHHFSFGGYQWEAAGPAGVSFFFILSGFVMSIGYKEKVLSQSFLYKNYIINRFIRVYPLHILSLLAYIAIFGVVLTTKQWLILPINLALLQSYIPYDSVYFSGNAVSWCLSTMFLFYVLFPFLFRYIHNHFRHSIFLLGVLIILYFMGIKNVSENLMHYVVYICPIFRVIDFIIGIVLFETYSRISKNIEIHNTLNILPSGLTTLLEISCFVPLAIVVLFYGSIPTQYALASLFWIPISIVILTLSMVRGGVSRLLSARWLQECGAISFTFYMVHQLFIIVADKTLGMVQLNVNYLFRFIVYFLIVLCVSYVVFRYIETPITNNLRRKYNAKTNSL